jgi:hypothetical protein
MSSLVIKLPPTTVSSGGTVSNKEWDVSDAVSIAVYSGEPPPPVGGVVVEVAFSGASSVFVPLVAPWVSHSTSRVPAVVTSSGPMILDGTGVAKMRFTLDSASTDEFTIRGSKQVRC